MWFLSVLQTILKSHWIYCLHLSVFFFVYDKATIMVEMKGICIFQCSIQPYQYWTQTHASGFGKSQKSHDRMWKNLRERKISRSSFPLFSSCSGFPGSPVPHFCLSTPFSSLLVSVSPIFPLTPLSSWSSKLFDGEREKGWEVKGGRKRRGDDIYLYNKLMLMWLK